MRQILRQSILAALLFAPRFSAAQTRASVAVEAANVRSAPSIDATIVATLARGTTVDVLEVRAPWVRVVRGTTAGWVRLNALGSVPGAPAEVGSPALSHAGFSDDGFSVGVLGSVTPVRSRSGADERHVAGEGLLTYQASIVTLFASGSVGTGGGYRSTMLGGGLGLRVIATDRVQVKALGGYTTYAESPVATGAAPPSAAWSTHGAAMGGLVSLRLAGSFRLIWHGRYVKGLGDDASLHFTRSDFGVAL